MNVIGFSHLEPYAQYFHDTNVGIALENGDMFAALEERYSRVKHHAGLPVGALRAVQRFAKLRLEDFDVVAVAENRQAKTAQLANLSGRQMDLEILPAPVCKGTDLFFCDHQLAHASVAFRLSPFTEALVVTLDGMGHDLGRPCFGAVFKGSGNTLARMDTCWSEGNSLGLFYGFVTQALGWSMSDGEGKTMALAALGDPSQAFEALAPYAPECRGGSLVGGHRWSPEALMINHRQVTLDPAESVLVDLIERVGRENVAAAAQAVLEGAVVGWVDALLKKFPETKNLCLAGGLFLNVVLNSRLRSNFPHIDFFVPSSPADGGIGLGAALEAAAQVGAARVSLTAPAFMGSSYASDVEIAGRLARHPTSQPEDLADAVAQLIEQGHVVGLHRGRSEWGPRALGNRSVLAHPGYPGIRDRLNRTMKQREAFMPFAPSILADRLGDWFSGSEAASPYMMFCYPIRPDRKDAVTAVLHDDGTARAHTVTENDNPFLHKILHAFERRTGLPMVLNTSFNLHGLPIVETPEDALDHLDWGCVDHLVLGNRLVGPCR